MSFLVIENWPSLEEAAIVVDQDTGKNKIFVSREQAETERLECQNGVIVEV